MTRRSDLARLNKEPVSDEARGHFGGGWLLTGYGGGHDVLADWHDGRVTELP